MNRPRPHVDEFEHEHAPRAHRALLLTPFLWQAALVPFVNDVAWQPWGLPFPMAWQMAGVVLTTGVIGVVYAIDRRIDVRAARGTDGAAAQGTDGRRTDQAR